MFGIKLNNALLKPFLLYHATAVGDENAITDPGNNVDREQPLLRCRGFTIL